MANWKNVEGFYAVSDQGEIYNLRRKRFLKPWLSRNGYLHVTLRGKNIAIHRLVARNFVDGYKPGLQVNHKDENKTNNKACNLEWCTQAYNNTYNGKTQRSCKPIRQLSRAGEFIRSWRSAREAYAFLAINYKNISACCHGKRKTTGGYRWCFE